MERKKVLLLHISNISGHHCASHCIERSLRAIEKDIEICNIDIFSRINSNVEKFVNAIYLFVIQFMPRLWDYLYDNEKVFKTLKRPRSFIHWITDKRLRKLVVDFRPDIIVCTQAFPCAMLADYKRRRNLDIPLIGVLTDYTTHRYWLDDMVNFYVVSTSEIKEKMVQRGIPAGRLAIFGIPIDSKFQGPNNQKEIFSQLGLNPQNPTILIMGGGQGLGPIKKIICILDRLSQPVQLVVVCGTNRNLEQWLNKNKSFFVHPLLVLGYVENIHDLMSISYFIITKPGGLTSAEALSQSLPIIIVNPLPGQERRNSRFLLKAGVALEAANLLNLRPLVEELLNNPSSLENLRKKTAQFAHPDSAFKISQLILQLIDKDHINRNKNVVYSL